MWFERCPQLRQLKEVPLKQQTYAAMDAWMTLHIYESIIGVSSEAQDGTSTSRGGKKKAVDKKKPPAEQKGEAKKLADKKNPSVDPKGGAKKPADKKKPSVDQKG